MRQSKTNASGRKEAAKSPTANHIDVTAATSEANVVNVSRLRVVIDGQLAFGLLMSGNVTDHPAARRQMMCQTGLLPLGWIGLFRNRF